MKPRLLVLLFLLGSSPLLAWNATGHQAVAGIAWDNMTPAARTKALAILAAAPADACMQELMPADERPLAERQREFFMKVATWPDLVRPKDDNDPRPCTRFHHPSWHFINFFFEGVSGESIKNRADLPLAEVNIIERLGLLDPLVKCDEECPIGPADRAVDLAWILHLTGDIHQPLHTAARITSEPGEEKGDQGGNLFKIGTGDRPPSLHGLWDGIVNRGIPRLPEETAEITYLDRVVEKIGHDEPKPALAARLLPENFAAWAVEGFTTTKHVAYPPTLHRGVDPGAAYRATAFHASEQAIALAGYRLADLLNRILGE